MAKCAIRVQPVNSGTQSGASTGSRLAALARQISAASAPPKAEQFAEMQTLQKLFASLIKLGDLGLTLVPMN